MARQRITKSKNKTHSLDVLYMNFIAEKKAMDLSEKSIKNYEDAFKKFREYTQEQVIDKALVVGYIVYLKEKYTATATINHYIRYLRAILYWCFDNGMEGYRFKISTIKGQETVKQPYTDEELMALLVKPQDDCSFTEYRNWIIIQTLLGTGIRAATLLNIQMKDLCLSSKQLILAHTKNKKAQIIPLSTSLCRSLRAYISLYREDCTPDSYLFPNVYDEAMDYNSLRMAITRYNNSRGVQKTSLHLFRHTFAKNFIIAGGDAMRLQKILGHSTLEMTRRYVNLYSTDLNNDFENFCPLDRMMPKGKKHSIK